MRVRENPVRNGRLCRSASRALASRKFLILVTLVCTGIQGTGASAEQPGPVQSKFLALDDAKRQWWYEGAFRMLAHAIAASDKKKGDCVADWYLKDRSNKRALIEAEIARNPQYGETTIILSLLEQACGRPLIP